MLVTGSPVCTMFIKLQNLSQWSVDKARRLRESREHIRFVAKLYTAQVQQGRMFLHEHPREATSWHLKEIKEVSKMNGVLTVDVDLCMFALTTRDRTKSEQAFGRKPTRFMANSWHIAPELGK